MAVKIRLMRIGAKGRPFYRVVAVDERKKRTGSYLELLGTYNPLTEPKEINLKQDRIDAWVKNGAQMSTGFLRIIGKAPQRVARKPKKDRGGNGATPAASTPVESAPAVPAEAATEAPQEKNSPEPIAEAESNTPETTEVASEVSSEEAPSGEENSEEKTA